ncbi:MAG TPA: TolC family protein [Candidatus Saccharicenans sp.]|nr:TolC family protein [Candidatus Saccharicenans sp.]
MNIKTSSRARRMINALTLAVLFLATSFSCVHYQARPITVQKSLAQYEERHLDSPELGQFLIANHEVDSWPPEVWDLKSLTLVAFYFNPQLDTARAQWAVARAGRLTAAQVPNPVIGPRIGYNSTTPRDLITPWMPEVSLDIPIEVAGKRGLRISEARHLSDAARYNILAAAWQVRSTLRQSLLDLYISEKKLSLLDEQIRIQKELVKLMELKKAAGDVSGYELTQSRLALETSQLDLIEAQKMVRQAKVNLASALGLGPEAVDSAKISFDDLEKVATDIPAGELRRQALTNRADILSLLSEYAAAEADLHLEIARQYPDITLSPDYQLDQTDNKWTIGLSFELPIFNRNRGPIAEAEARRREKAAEFLELQAAVISDLEKSIQNVRAAGQKVLLSDELLQHLEAQKAVASRKLQAGEISKYDFLNLNLELTASSLARLETLAEAQQATIELENILQSPLQMKDWLYTLDRGSHEVGQAHDERETQGQTATAAAAKEKTKDKKP